MKCESCRRREASVHWSGHRDGEASTLWLCPVCADEMSSDVGGGRAGEVADLGAFLAEGSGTRDVVCPACGWTGEDFQSANRVGCPRCYGAFRAVLMPLLGRFHRHVSHMGRTPARLDTGPSPLAEITQARVSLDKAVAGEEFEQAARIRDRIRDLEALLDPGPVEP